MTRIKICGLTNEADVRAAVRFGADALGFIGVPETPRYVTPEEMRRASMGLPPFVQRVVVVRQLIEVAGYATDAVQYYGGDTTAVGLRRIRVFRVKNRESLTELREYRQAPDAVLLDAYHETALGGAGTTFDWSLAREATAMLGDIPLILAGGLTAENVGEAVRAVRPYAVDVSSGVEREPRYKDHDKLRRFIEAVRSADVQTDFPAGENE